MTKNKNEEILRDYLIQINDFTKTLGSLYSVSNNDRIFLYESLDINKVKINENGCITGEPKLGQLMVKAGENPLIETLNRVRAGLGQAKYLFDTGQYILFMYWDATDYAKKYNIFSDKAHVDTHIRKQIGHKIQKETEYHIIDPMVFMKKITTILTANNQDLPIVYLSSRQYRGVSTTIDMFLNKQYRVVAGDLFARFGKTIYALSVFIECNYQLLIWASYVKSSKRSAQNEISRRKQFSTICEIDAEENNYEQKLLDAIKSNKKIIVYLSLCNGKKRNDRIKLLLSQKISTLLVIDELDFGAWQKNQSLPVIEAFEKNDNMKVILMSGSGIDKASKFWKIDGFILETYIEALVDKYNAINGLPSMISNLPYTLKYFKVNQELDKNLPDLRLWQVDLKRIVEHYINTHSDLVDEDFKNLPAWNKTLEYPEKAKGFISGFIKFLNEILFNGQHNFDEANISFIKTEADRIKNTPNNSSKNEKGMWWLPARTKIENIDRFSNIIKEGMPNIEHIPLHGSIVNNYDAENYVLQIIEKLQFEGNKKYVLIISALIGQRSFTVDIVDIFLGYDNGSKDTTDQRISRGLSPSSNKNDKITNVFSLSFDPNRDDKIDLFVLEAALNITKKHKTHFNDAMNTVLKSIDIFSSNQNGVQLINHDEFIQGTMGRGTASRAMGIISDFSGLPREILKAWAEGNVDFRRDDILEAARKGLTRDKRSRKHKSSRKTIKEQNEELTLLSKCRLVAMTLIDEFNQLFIATQTTNCKDAINKCIKNNWHEDVFNEHGISLDLIHYFIVETNRIKAEWIESRHNKTIVEIRNNKNNEN